MSDFPEICMSSLIYYPMILCVVGFVAAHYVVGILTPRPMRQNTGGPPANKNLDIAPDSDSDSEEEEEGDGDGDDDGDDEDNDEDDGDDEDPPRVWLMFKPYNPEIPHIAPVRGSESAAGFDLHASEDLVIPVGETRTVGTNLAVAIPGGCYGRIAPRSSLALKGVVVNGGVIDADYRGEIRVIILNGGKDEFVVKEGNRIAQLILEKCEYAELMLADELPITHRGEGGFGSTGI